MTSEDHDDPHVLLYRAPDATEAAMLVHTLKAEGIAAKSVGGAMQWTWGETGAEALMVEVWVPSNRLEDGRRSIERYYAERRNQADAPEPPAWTCSCGETNGGGFALCWSCQARRSS